MTTQLEAEEILCTALDVDSRTLEKWRGEGMPAELVNAAGWCYRTGRVRTVQLIVGTHAQLACFFACGLDVIRSYWVKHGMPGRRGAYKLADVIRWKEKRNGDTVYAPDGRLTLQRRHTQSRVSIDSRANPNRANRRAAAAGRGKRMASK